MAELDKSRCQNVAFRAALASDPYVLRLRHRYVLYWPYILSNQRTGRKGPSRTPALAGDGEAGRGPATGEK